MKTRCSTLVRLLSVLGQLANTRRRLASSVMLAAAVFAAPLQAQIVFDATADFSITSGNPNGAWSYGWMPTDFRTFNLHTNATTNVNGDSPGWDSVSSVWKNLGNEAYDVPTGWLSLHPGGGEEPSVVRWTSPGLGWAHIHGRFLAGNPGIMLVAVRMNGQAVWQAVDSGAFDLLESILPGDTVDFVVYGGVWAGNTPLEAIISLTLTPVILFRRDSVIVQEAQPSLVLEVLRFGPELFLDEEVAVDYTTVEGTARAGEDYVAASGTLHFAAGETNKQIVIEILDDALAEGVEQFSLVLSNPTGGVSLGNSMAIWIQSDEPTTYYVNVNNLNPVFPYASWATAATNIQDAVDVSKSGDTVLVTNGVYAVGGAEPDKRVGSCVRRQSFHHQRHPVGERQWAGGDDN